MPDGGKVGWYTNWVDQSRGAQAWADFYLAQLIPWVDANLRTIATKQGRAIAGLSMGGFGAVRFAQDRPDLFNYVASFSGAVDLNDYGTRGVIGEQAGQNGFNPAGPFGNPFPPFDRLDSAPWIPLSRAARLRGVGVALYVGSGIHDYDVLERTMANSAAKLAPGARCRRRAALLLQLRTTRTHRPLRLRRRAQLRVLELRAADGTSSDRRRAPGADGVSAQRLRRVKLYVCYGFMQNIRTTGRPGGHPCGNALHALRDAGHSPEVIPVHGLGVPGLDKLGKRDEVQEVSGQRVVPVLVTDTDEVVTDSKKIVAWAQAHPVA